MIVVVSSNSAKEQIQQGPPHHRGIAKHGGQQDDPTIRAFASVPARDPPSEKYHRGEETAMHADAAGTQCQCQCQWMRTDVEQASGLLMTNEAEHLIREGREEIRRTSSICRKFRLPMTRAPDRGKWPADTLNPHRRRAFA